MRVPDCITQETPSGFTLLEILVSIAVIAIALVSVFRLHSGTLKLTDATRSNALLPVVAFQHLADITSRSQTFSGQGKQNKISYRWSCAIEDRSFDDPIAISPAQAKRFKKLTLTIETQRRTLTLTTWRYLGEPQD